MNTRTLPQIAATFALSLAVAFAALGAAATSEARPRCSLATVKSQCEDVDSGGTCSRLVRRGGKLVTQYGRRTKRICRRTLIYRCRGGSRSRISGKSYIAGRFCNYPG